MEYFIQYYGSKRKSDYVVCTQCDTSFLKPLYKITGRKTHFCNKECWIKYQSRNKVQCECYQCQKSIFKKQSQLKLSKSGLFFCSNECKNIASLTVEAIRPKHFGTSNKYNPTRICLNCNEPLKNNTSSYCNYDCKFDYRYKKYIEKWKNGLVTGNVGDNEENISSYIRRYIFEKYDSKCQKCGWNEIHSITNKVPLQVNHIDGNHKNSIESNLELLCPNCHSLTTNFGSLNMGNGRVSRKIKVD